MPAHPSNTPHPPRLLLPAAPPSRGVVRGTGGRGGLQAGDDKGTAGVLKGSRGSPSCSRGVSSLVRPPIQVYGLEGRYATALYSAATKQNKLEQVEKELTRVRSLLKDPKLSSVVMNPHTKSSVKQKAVNDALAREKMSPITVNLMNLLAENGRLRYTPGIVSAFGKIMSAFRGEVVCTVTTAQPLDDASLSELKSVLNGFLAKGEVLKLETKVCILDLQINVTMCMLRVSVCLIFTKTKYFVESMPLAPLGAVAAQPQRQRESSRRGRQGRAVAALCSKRKAPAEPG
ncbi:PREDICTED: ATP synthase subunit O, mitochondrial [Ficedula albicollis]|uniref:ATP synthase subunit O, mitochondrial n=1 Tax=Ficedula albicollis TaxID=59894 RepID=UPI0007AD7A2E|nr:PREDICTED: ATP synthase subunit O, mitochondrial [Ficedula albicollis]